jgi:hypothetical protein
LLAKALIEPPVAGTMAALAVTLASCAFNVDTCGVALRIPAMPITDSNLMAIRIPIDADHHRSEATLDCTYHRQ